MEKNRAASEQVAFMAKAHHGGILCPSECWRQIAAALVPATATAVLDVLPGDAQENLLEMYRDRPPIAYVRDCQNPAGDDALRAVCVQIVNWCEAKAPAELPAEPDGIIRVRVVDGTIEEWQ